MALMHGKPDTSIHFGEFEDTPIDWREADLPDDDPDDEELETSPADVVAMLGFDPKSLL